MKRLRRSSLPIRIKMVNTAITPAVTKGPSKFWTDSKGLTAGTSSTASAFEGEAPRGELSLFVSVATDDPGVTVATSFASSWNVSETLLRLLLLGPGKEWILSSRV